MEDRLWICPTVGKSFTTFWPAEDSKDCDEKLELLKDAEIEVPKSEAGASWEDGVSSCRVYDSS